VDNFVQNIIRTNNKVKRLITRRFIKKLKITGLTKQKHCVKIFSGYYELNNTGGAL